MPRRAPRNAVQWRLCLGEDFRVAPHYPMLTVLGHPRRNHYGPILNCQEASKESRSRISLDTRYSNLFIRVCRAISSHVERCVTAGATGFRYLACLDLIQGCGHACTASYSATRLFQLRAYLVRRYSLHHLHFGEMQETAPVSLSLENSRDGLQAPGGLPLTP